MFLFGAFEQLAVARSRTACILLVSVISLGVPDRVFCATPLRLVRDGRAICVVVQAPGTIPAFAANELREHIRLITGAEVPVVHSTQFSNAEAGRVPIFVGASDHTDRLGVSTAGLKPEGFRVKTVGGSLVLLGRGRGSMKRAFQSTTWDTELGTLTAVCDFLETLGVRWFWPGPLGTVIPKRDALEVGTLDRTGSPDFSIRRIGIRITPPPGDLSPEDRKQLERAQHEADLWRLRNRGGMSNTRYLGRHAFGKWWEMYGEEHPTWFGLYQGRRGWPARYERSKLCVSNTEVIDAVAKMAIEQFRRNPKQSVAIGENDGSPGFCQCPNCLALDDPDAIIRHGKRKGLTSLSDRYAWFWNQVAQRTAVEFRDRYVSAYIYSRYREVPTKVKRLHPNVAPILCNNWLVDTERQHHLVEGWGAMTETPFCLYQPPVIANGRGKLGLPAVGLKPTAAEMCWLRDRGIVGWKKSTFDNSLANTGLMSYTTARLAWDVDIDVNTLLDDYCEKLFGDGAEPMKRYFERLEQEQLDTPWPTDENDPEGRPQRPIHLEYAVRLYTSGFLNELQGYLDHARRLTQGDDLNSRRVSLIMQGLEYTRLQTNAFRTYWHFVDSGEGLDAAISAAGARTAFLDALPIHNQVFDWDSLSYFPAEQGLTFAEMIVSYDIIAPMPRKWRVKLEGDNAGAKRNWHTPDFDDSDWRTVSVSRGWDGQGFEGVNGWAWYRVNVAVPESAKSKRILLNFRIRRAECTLYLNGQEIVWQRSNWESKNTGKNAPFIDVTEHLHPGQNNVFAVRVLGQTQRGQVWAQPIMLLTTSGS